MSIHDECAKDMQAGLDLLGADDTTQRMLNNAAVVLVPCQLCPVEGRPPHTLEIRQVDKSYVVLAVEG
jgi:hypothetical protein